MIDTYVKSTDQSLLAEYLSFFSTTIGPMSYVPSVTAEDGTVTPARGQEGYWYGAVRAMMAMPLVEGIETAEDGQDVVGVWLS